MGSVDAELAAIMRRLLDDEDAFTWLDGAYLVVDGGVELGEDEQKAVQNALSRPQSAQEPAQVHVDESATQEAPGANKGDE